jgi:hypothetical protein
MSSNDNGFNHNHDGIKIVGEITIYDQNGNIVATAKNLIVDVGKTALAQILQQTSSTTPFLQIAQIGVGNSSTAPAANQTDLLGTNKVWQNITSRTYVSNTAYFSANFDYSTANFVWNEVGLRAYDGSSYKLISRLVLSSPITKTSSVYYTVEYRLTIV